jgi:hypothetical protein
MEPGPAAARGARHAASPAAGEPTREPIECPHCGEPTLANLRADGSVVCSCAASRDLPPAPPRR